MLKDLKDERSVKWRWKKVETQQKIRQKSLRIGGNRDVKLLLHNLFFSINWSKHSSDNNVLELLDGALKVYFEETTNSCWKGECESCSDSDEKQRWIKIFSFVCHF